MQLRPRLRGGAKVFDIHQSIFTHDEINERKAHKYIDGLMEAFAASPEAEPLLEQDADLGWAAMMMQYAIDYEGVTPPEMTRGHLEEVVFTLFPRKVSTEPESAPEIVTVLRAF